MSRLKPFAFRLPVDLVGRVDDARGDVPRTRFVVRALEQALGVSPAVPSGGDQHVTSGSVRASAFAKAVVEEFAADEENDRAVLNRVVHDVKVPKTSASERNRAKKTEPDIIPLPPYAPRRT